MDIEIRVGSHPEQQDAQIRRTTFNQVQRIKRLQPINDENVIIAGDTFGYQFSILLSDDETLTENILFVSRAVKQRFYLNVNILSFLDA